MAQDVFQWLRTFLCENPNTNNLNKSLNTGWFDSMFYKIAIGLFVILSEWSIKEI